MAKKAHRISFDMDTFETDLVNELLPVQNNFYTKKVSRIARTMRFPIPTSICEELNLNVSDICYFIKYTEGYYIAFNTRPNDVLERNIRSRKLIKAGMYNTLFVAIPQFIQQDFTKAIQYVQLIHPKGFKQNEWQIRFITECI